MSTVKGYQLNDARLEFTEKRLLAANEIGKRVPATDKKVISEATILRNRIHFADSRKSKIDEVAPIFEANAGKPVDLSNCRINEYGEIERDEGITA